MVYFTGLFASLEKSASSGASGADFFPLVAVGGAGGLSNGAPSFAVGDVVRGVDAKSAKAALALAIIGDDGFVERVTASLASLGVAEGVADSGHRGGTDGVTVEVRRVEEGLAGSHEGQDHKSNSLK